MESSLPTLGRLADTSRYTTEAAQVVSVGRGGFGKNSKLFLPLRRRVLILHLGLHTSLQCRTGLLVVEFEL